MTSTERGTHPGSLWGGAADTGPVVKVIDFQIVRPMGVTFYHQRRAGEDAALCGLEPPAGRRGRWNVEEALPEGAPFCQDCWVAWGKAKLANTSMSKTALMASAAWPFPSNAAFVPCDTCDSQITCGTNNRCRKVKNGRRL